MKNYSKNIETIIYGKPENRIIDTNILYKEYFSTIPEATYYKVLGRLCEHGTLVRLARGLYYRPQKSRFGLIPIGEQEIVRYYTRNSQGVVVGYKLYNKKRITTQIGKRVDVISSIVYEQSKNVGNVHIIKSGVDITQERIPVIETLEILQNYSDIEDKNNVALGIYMRDFALKYSDSVAVYVLQKRKYKKSTIAFLESFLDYLNVKNSLQNFLSPLSTYKIPKMEEFYESA